MILVASVFVFVLIQTIDTRDNPTSAQAEYFIKADATSNHPYVTDTYDCHQFSVWTQYNASLLDIKCAYVLVSFEVGTPHAIVAFNTTDRGLIFFEPQADLEVDCEIGEYYVMPGNRRFKIQNLEYLWYIVKQYEE